MSKQEVSTQTLRQPMGHFSQATVVEASGKLVFISGMTARRADGTIAGIGNITEQTRQVCENIKAAVETAGGTLDDVCRVDVYVRNTSTKYTQSGANISNLPCQPRRWLRSRKWSRPTISSK